MTAEVIDETTPGLVQVHRHNDGVYLWVNGVPGAMGRGRTAIEAFADWQAMADLIGAGS